MLAKSEYVSQLYAYDKGLLDKYRSSSEAAAQEKAELSARRILEKEAEDELEQEEERLEEALSGLRDSYDNYDERLAAAKSRAAQLQARLEEQKAYLNRLEEKKRREEAAAAAAAAAQAAQEAASAAWTSATETSSEGYVNGIPVHIASDLEGYRQPSGTTGQDVVNFACQFVGKSYVWGGTSLTRGCDCSGFTQTVYSLFGYSIPRTAEMQLLYGTEVDSLDSAKPGDLICYAGHVAFYIGNGQIVHAASTTSGIIYGSATYRTILGIRRIIS
jgi:cell wall-associated NlpC family hydrolase